MKLSEPSNDSIEAAHQQLIQYTEEAPRMLEQVDVQQFTKLGVKYHHLLMKFERNKALLRKRMEMHADLQNIVLQSPTVQTQIKLIEEIEKNCTELRSKKAAVESGLSGCRRQIEQVQKDIAELKKVLFQQKHQYFDTRVGLEQMRKSSMPRSPKPAKTIFPTDENRNEPNSLKIQKKCSLSTPVSSQAEAISTLLVGLRKLQRELFRTNQRDIGKVLKHTKILRSLKSSINQEKHPKNAVKYGIEDAMKRVAMLTNCRLSVMSDLRNNVDICQEQEMLKRIKSGMVDWPSEWLLQQHERPVDPPTKKDQKFAGLNGEQLFRLLCQDRNKLERFWEALNRKLQSSSMSMTSTL